MVCLKGRFLGANFVFCKKRLVHPKDVLFFTLIHTVSWVYGTTVIATVWGDGLMGLHSLGQLCLN